MMEKLTTKLPKITLANLVLCHKSFAGCKGTGEIGYIAVRVPYA